MSIIHLPQVSISQSAFPVNAMWLIFSIATSGACATIASDALMNPFDGESSYTLITFII